MKIFNTLADLKAAKLTTGQLVETKGNVSVGDGLGAKYLIGNDVADEVEVFALANNNTATQVTNRRFSTPWNIGELAAGAVTRTTVPTVNTTSSTIITASHTGLGTNFVTLYAYPNGIDSVEVVAHNADSSPTSTITGNVILLVN